MFHHVSSQSSIDACQLLQNMNTDFVYKVITQCALVLFTRFRRKFPVSALEVIVFLLQQDVKIQSNAHWITLCAAINQTLACKSPHQCLQDTCLNLNIEVTHLDMRNVYNQLVTSDRQKHNDLLFYFDKLFDHMHILELLHQTVQLVESLKV